jgi:tRNA (cmo5U34)-methyltransferase
MAREYDSESKAARYVAGAEAIPHRQLGEQMLVDRLPRQPLRVLDLGCGDGRLLALVLAHRNGSSGVAVDVSPPMLERARQRFASTARVEVLEHDLATRLPTSWERFDAIVSSFAIHHLQHERKRELYSEIFFALRPGGVFCNLEHVSSPSPGLHRRFIEALGVEEDKTNVLLDVETQLRWLREIGFLNVDCDWKWLELALLAGTKPSH